MVRIDTCPRQWVGSDVWELLTYADLYAKGNPPVAGGALDQTQWFVDACRIAWSEEATWKNKLGIMF